MGTPHSNNGTNPPVVYTPSYLQPLVSPALPSATAPPTGPRSLLRIPTSGPFDWIRAPGTGTSYSHLPSNATCTHRIRPYRWDTLCRNTVPSNQTYPPASSHVTNPGLCKRGAECYFGHHGDVYGDAPDLKGLIFEYGKPCDRASHDAKLSNEHGPGNATNTPSNHISPTLGAEGRRNPNYNWVERRQEWRKREAAASGRLNLEAENICEPLRWEDTYKRPGDAMQQKSDLGRNEGHTLYDKENHKASLEKRSYWGDYARRPRSSTLEEGLSSHWGMDATIIQHYTKVSNLEEKVGENISDAELSTQQGTASGQEERESMYNQTQQNTNDTSSPACSIASMDSSSTIEFIIPHFTKRHVNASAALTANECAEAQHNESKISTTPIVTSTSEFALDPLAPAFVPVCALSTIQSAATGTTPASSKNDKKIVTASANKLVESPPKTFGMNNDDGNSVQTNYNWDIYRRSKSISHIPDPSQSSESPEMLWRKLEIFHSFMEERKKIPQIHMQDWKPYPINTGHGNYPQKISPGSPQYFQSQNRTSNTIIVQSCPRSLQPEVNSTNVGTVPYRAAPSFYPQSRVNYTLDQIKAMLSHCPDSPNKSYTIALLSRLVIPELTQSGKVNGQNAMGESLQTAFHRFSLSIDPEESILVEKFRTEMWSVLAWFTGNGGSVAVLEKKNVPESKDENNNGKNATSRESGALQEDLKGIRRADIKMTSGQVAIHAIDGLHNGYNEVVGLTPGEPAILSPAMSPGTPPKVTDRFISALLLNGPPIVTASSMPTPSDVEDSPMEPPQPLPSALADTKMIPLWTPNIPQSDPAQETVESEKLIKFFLSDKMDIYLEDSYDKVLQVQTAISLKWRRARKIFEREWSSGISRFARKSVVTRAIWKVYEMEEINWLDAAASLDPPWSKETLERERNLSPRPSTGNEIAQHHIAWAKLHGLSHKAVWDRRALCIEAEPVALSEKGEYLCKLIDKMCIRKLMEFRDLQLEQESHNGLKLPVCPDVSYLPPHFRESQSRTTERPMNQSQWERGHQENLQWKENSDAGSGDHGRAQQRRESEAHRSTNFDANGQSDCPVNQESTLPSDVSDRDFIHHLIDQLRLQPQLIPNPVLDPIFAGLEPTFFQSKEQGCELPSEEQMKREERARSSFLELCHLDRMLFMGYIVLEILNIWEEQRRDVGRVRWKFPYVNGTTLLEENARQCVRETLNTAQLTQAQNEKPPPLVSIGNRASRKNGKNAAKAGNTAARSCIGQSKPLNVQEKRMELAVLDSPIISSSPCKRELKAEPVPALLYADVCKGKTYHQQNVEAPRPSTASANREKLMDPANNMEEAATDTREGFIKGTETQSKKKGRRRSKNKATTVTSLATALSVDEVLETTVPEDPICQPKEDESVSDNYSAEQEKARDYEHLLARHMDYEKLKDHILEKLEALEAEDLKAERNIIRVWLKSLQDWLWSYGEGVGVNFVETTEDESGGDDDADDWDGGKKKKIHRGGRKNKGPAKYKPGPWSMVIGEEKKKEWTRRLVESEMREQGMWFMRGGLVATEKGGNGSGKGNWWSRRMEMEQGGDNVECKN
ncbi:hypothetical protein BDZ91DRAFT_729517 [Kalaharituber pfeilii]|nr:hypothetical protein BDZ91DRAFT_729517 [Kalaharituber pfeilii]